VALIGANGKGKSTLLRIIAGIEPIEGQRIWGHNVKEAFYAQHQLEALDLNNNILQEMATSSAAKTELEYRSLLGCFLFGGEEVEKKIRVLSGGEKARVALAKTIVSKANFLMLDEPTNHLDMHSVDLLIEALNKYEGSIILVSHDRYFISKVANVFWEIIDFKIREFRGTYEEYVIWKEKIIAEQQLAAKSAVPAAQDAVKAPDVKQVQTIYIQEPSGGKGKPFNKDLQKEFQKQQKALERLEVQIAETKGEMAKQEGMLALPETYGDLKKFKATEDAYAAALKKLNEFQAQYETAFEKMMELEDELKG
jgi:ATP-binding cassette subfamily F protein 3